MIYVAVGHRNLTQIMRYILGALKQMYSMSKMKIVYAQVVGTQYIHTGLPFYQIMQKYCYSVL